METATCSSDWKFMVKVYSWMMWMLVVTSIVAIVSALMQLHLWFQQHLIIFSGVCLLQLMIIFSFAHLRKVITVFSGISIAVLYSVLNGLTIPVFLPVQGPWLAIFGFLGAAVIFGVATVYGFFAKKDLKIWIWFVASIVGVVIAMILNSILKGTITNYGIPIAGVILFTGFTIQDTQRIKKRSFEDCSALSALEMALEIYLNFLNIFWHEINL